MQPSNLSAMAWGLLAIPIVVFYILKIRMRRMPVSTIMFWNQVFEDRRPRSIWQKLRHLLSLLLQLLFLLLLIGALVDPLLTTQSNRPRRIVLILDHSASMNAREDGGQSALERAKAKGLHLVRGLRTRDEMALVAVSSAARVRCGLTSHQRTLANALDAIPPTDCPTRMEPAISLARRLVADHVNAEIILLSDGCAAELVELVEAEDVRVVTVGRPLVNVGITQFQVRRSLIDSIGYQTLVEVTNQSDKAVECRLEVELEDPAALSDAGPELVDVIPLKLEAGESWKSVLDHTSAAGGRLVARLDRPDSLECDNEARALLPRRKIQRVLLVCPESNVFLERVFEAIPLVAVTVSPELPTAVEPGTIVVFHRPVPAELPVGHVLVIEPTTSGELWKLGETLENPLVTSQTEDSPLMTHVHLDNVFMPDARQLELEPGHEVLAESLDGTAVYCAWNRPGGKVVLLNVNLAKGDLPLRTAFPIMMTNAMAWFQGAGGELREALPAGSSVEVDLSELNANAPAALVQPAANRPPLVLRSPAGIDQPIPPGLDVATIGPLDRVGVWSVLRPSVEATGGANDQAIEIACNLANRDESDLRPVINSDQADQIKGGWMGGLPIWFYLAAMALLLIIGEWFLYQRRWIG